MHNGYINRAARATITWRTCPRCGALGPHIQAAGSCQTLQPQCCGVLRFSPVHAVWPEDPIRSGDTGEPDESDNP